MKATDLMIGDWVKLSKGNWSKNGQVGLTDIEMIAESVYLAEPIPLTPKILEKNGFEKQNNYQWKYRDGYCKIVVSIAPKIEIDGELLVPSPIDVEIEGALFALNKTNEWCVHELQHALKLCGIEKEIVL